MIRHGFGRAAAVAAVASLIALSAGATPALGYGFAARASVSPTALFVGDASGTLLTFTVKNTGTTRSVGSVQISRPFSFWTILSCPSAPTGWSAVTTASDCTYLSQPGSTDDIAPRASATFTLVAASAPAIADRSGTWRVVVSRTNNFGDPSVLKQATAKAPGLTTHAFSFELTDVIAADEPATVGHACPATNRTTTRTTNVTLVACGLNHTTITQHLRPRYAHLSGDLIASPGTFHGGLVPSSASSVVLGNWTGVHLYSGSDVSLSGQVGAWPGRTSPKTRFGGFETPVLGPDIAPSEHVEGAKDGQQATFIEHVTNTSAMTDSYSLSVSGGTWDATIYDATCTTPLSTTATIATGHQVVVCVKVDVPADAVEQDANDTTLSATSTLNPSATSSATLTTLAVQFGTLLVDGDTNSPVDSAPYYRDALDANGVDYGYWDLAENAALPQSFLNAHGDVVWFTGNTYSAPLSSYEARLTSYLNGGGRLLLSGPDILDGSAGTSTFVHDYLHVDWDGTEVQNDKATAAVHSVDGNPVTDGIGDVPLDHSVLNEAFEDEITPIDPADAAFSDDNAKTNALTVADAGYKVVFLPFPFEGYGAASDKADLVNRVLTWFGS